MIRILIVSVFLFATISVFSQFVDENTPENVLPNNNNVGKEWVLEFSDEFNGTSVNTTKWRIDNSSKSRAARPSIGISDWRWKPENVSVSNGNLILKVFKAAEGTMTNGSINSYTKYTTQYGYFETRLKIAQADMGTHTAFWLQGPNMSNVDGTANDGAEIDVFESAWLGDFTKSVVHIDGYGADHQANTKRYETPGIHDGFHTWGFHWTEYFMDIYYDGVFKVRYSDPKWVVKSPEFLWLSNGASFGLTGDQYFVDRPIGFLTQTEVDYIRVWKDASTTADSLLDNSNWSLIMVDSEDTYASNLGINAIDGNPFSFWHTEWKDNQPPQPHEIQIDLGDTAMIWGFKYMPRQDNNPNGNIDDYQFFATNDLENWGEPLKTGSFSTTGDAVYVSLDDTVKFRYIRLVALSEINGLKFANMAELSLVGKYLKDVNVSIKKVENNFPLKIYPNPFTHELSVSAEDIVKQASYTIYALNGSSVISGIISSESNTTVIPTANLDTGVYIFKLTSEDNVKFQKIVKK